MKMALQVDLLSLLGLPCICFSHVNDPRVQQFFWTLYWTVRCIVGVMRVRDFSTATEAPFDFLLVGEIFLAGFFISNWGELNGFLGDFDGF